MKLTAEQIEKNWEALISYIDIYVSEPRKTQLRAFYNKYAERIIMMPASHKKEYHNAFPGGYVEHVNRVIEAAIHINEVWNKFGATQNYTKEELVFSALNHDLGKMGDEQHESYLPQTDQWRKDKLGEDYMFNNKLEYMSVPDRSLYLLLENGINFSKNEMLAIKLHDGLYDESNKSYLMGWLPEQKLRCVLPFIIHQADLLAARIEFEREWFPKFQSSGDKSKTDNTFELNNKSNKKIPIKTQALSSVKSESLQNAMNNFFKE